MSNTYNLQLRHGAVDQNFKTRGEVISYINLVLQHGISSVLPYEPILFFYGEDDEHKNAIIMVGLPDGATKDGQSYFIVDTENLQEGIDKLEENTADFLKKLSEEEKARTDKDTELEKAIETERDERKEKDKELEDALNFSKDDIKSVIKACGLIYNDKQSEDRASYSPEPHNEIIRDSKTISDAVDKIAEFAVQMGKNLKFTVEDTDTVDLTLNDDEKNGGHILSADVKVSGSDGLSKRLFDNNIIGKTSDGLYASASLEASDSNPNVLIFKTSGYSDGKFKVDAYETEVKLTPYVGDNGKDSGVTVSVDSEKNKVSAKLNLSTSSENILKLEDGEYSVDGTAKSIKYKDTTVAKELDKHVERLDGIDEEIESVKSVEFKGSDSDTVSIVSSKSAKGDFTVNGNVKLSTDKSIIVSNGGLSANVSASFKKGTSTLTISVGNNTYDIDLTDMAVSVLKKAEYDSATEEIVLTFIVGDSEKTLRIPVDRLIHDLEVDDTDTIDLTLTSVSGGPNRISGQLRVDNVHTDNILSVSSNGAYVSKSYITEAVNAESDSRKESEAEIKDSVKGVTDTANANKDAIAAEIKTARAAEEANATSILNETERAKTSEKKLEDAISKNTSDIKQNATDINASVKTVSDAVNANKEAIAEEVKTARSAEEANKALVSKEVERAKTAEEVLEGKIAKNTSDIKEVSTSVGNIELRKESDASYALYVNNTKHGELTIPKDQFLNDVTYDTTKKELVFNFNTTAGSSVTKISIADLVDVYTNGNGILLDGNSFSVDFKSVASVDIITNETNRAKEAEAAIGERIANAEAVSTTKANSSDVYTKNEITTTLSGYAKASDVQQKLDAKLNVTDAKNVYATKDSLEAVKDGYVTTDTLNTTTTQISGRIDANKVSIDNFGLSYNAATSELVFTDKNGVKNTYKLYSGSLIKGGTFDTKSNSIVLTIETAGVESEITIPVSELLSDISGKIDDNTDSIKAINSEIQKLSKDWDAVGTQSVDLKKSTVGEKDSLSASVRLSSSNKQGIQSTADGLYVSNDLEDYTVVFGSTGTISGQQAISTLLEDATKTKNDLTNLINKNTDSIASLKEMVNSNTEKISSLNTSVETIKSRMDKVEKDMTTLKETVLSYDKQLETINNTITTLTEKVDTIINGGATDTELEKRVTDIEDNKIGPTDGSAKGSLWEKVNSMVDSGVYK